MMMWNLGTSGRSESRGRWSTLRTVWISWRSCPQAAWTWSSPTLLTGSPEVVLRSRAAGSPLWIRAPGTARWASADTESVATTAPLGASPAYAEKACSGKVAGRRFSWVALAFATPGPAGNGWLVLTRRDEEVRLERAAHRANNKGSCLEDVC